MGLPFLDLISMISMENVLDDKMTLTPTGGNNYYLKDDAQIILGQKINLSILYTIRSEYWIKTRLNDGAPKGHQAIPLKRTLFTA